VFAMAVMLGPALGPTLGGYITDHYSWPWIFYINLPIGLLGMFMVMTFVHEDEEIVHHNRELAAAQRRNVDWLGIALMVVGLVLGLTAYPMSHNTTNPLSQNDAINLGIGGIVCVIAGAALFLRYSIASFLRFWLARLIYEQKAQTDRLLGDRNPPVA